MVVERPAGFQTGTSFYDLDIDDKLTTVQKTALGRRSVADEQMYDDMMAIMELLGMKNNKTMTIRMALSNYRQQLEKEKASR